MLDMHDQNNKDTFADNRDDPFMKAIQYGSAENTCT